LVAGHHIFYEMIAKLFLKVKYNYFDYSLFYILSVFILYPIFTEKSALNKILLKFLFCMIQIPQTTFYTLSCIILFEAYFTLSYNLISIL